MNSDNKDNTTSSCTSINLFREDIDHAFSNHDISKLLDLSFIFYDSLSSIVFSIGGSPHMLFNIDSTFFQSIAGTIESIKSTLVLGRIADAYTLLRRYSETCKRQIQTMVYHELRATELGKFLKSEGIELSIDKVEQLIEGFIKFDKTEDDLTKFIANKQTLKLKNPSQLDYNDLEHIVKLFDRNHYSKIFDRCNDYVHINKAIHLTRNSFITYNDLVINFDQFTKDFVDLLIYHLAFIFTLHPEYMSSDDYVTMLEFNETPPDDSQYWVTPFVQDIFDQIVQKYRPDVKEYIKNNTCMYLE